MSRSASDGSGGALASAAVNRGGTAGNVSGVAAVGLRPSRRPRPAGRIVCLGSLFCRAESVTQVFGMMWQLVANPAYAMSEQALVSAYLVFDDRLVPATGVAAVHVFSVLRVGRGPGPRRER